MTHLAMSSGRSELVGSISAISAMRHMWSEMLHKSAHVSCLYAGMSRNTPLGLFDLAKDQLPASTAEALSL
jgi:hypothetical protein